jgi:acyl-CoA thioester hydrolase
MSDSSFKTTVRVTWADTDAAGVVHFSRFFVFFERTEEEFYRSVGLSFKDLRDKGLWLPRVEAFCQYKKPARFEDILEVKLTLEELREKSAKLGFIVTNKETAELLATGYFVVVAADKNTGRATQIPKEFADRLKPFAKQIL